MDNSFCDLKGINNTSLCEYLTVNCDRSYYYIAQSFYCSHSEGSLLLVSLGVTLSVFLPLYIIGLVSSNYLLFAITNFTELLNISRNVLSYVVIPILNCLPDILNYHFMIRSKSTDLVLGQAIGANLITFSIIVGSISILTPFTLHSRRELLQEYCYVCGSIVLLSYVLSDSKITFLECLVLISLYPLHIWTSLQSNADIEAPEDPEMVESSCSSVSECTNLLHQNENTHKRLNGRNSHTVSNLISILNNFCDHILFFIIPISKTTVEKLSMNENSLKKRMINSHMFHLWLVLFSTIFLNFYTLKLTSLTLMCCGLIIFMTTLISRRILSQNICNVFVDICSISNSFMIITQLTKIVIQLLRNLEKIWQISDYIMGLLTFSLVNSMNDIIINISLSRNISPSLGIKSCMGSCCLLISIGIGFNALWGMIGEGFKSGHYISQSLPVNLNRELYVSLTALNFVVIFTMTYIASNGWKFDRLLGIFLTCVWLVSTIVCVIFDLAGFI